MADGQTIVDVLQRRAALQPDRPAYAFLLDGERQRVEISYAELHRRAMAVAALLEQRGVVGEPVILCYPSSLEFIVAFFGCLYAGSLAVPVPMHRVSVRARSVKAIVAHAGTRLALTTSQVDERLRRSLGGDSPVQVAATDGLEAAQPDVLVGRPQPSATAFLQYTSGSTAQPRGVVVTHANISHNQHVISKAFQSNEDSIVVGWLPMFHDMGLLGNVLHPLWVGFPCVLMAPHHFLERPMRWLQAISRERATISGGPSFAYALCASTAHPDDLRALDLTSWRVAFNGAEPVRADVMAEFAARFAPTGFVKRAFYPCYGLAEATLFVTGGEVGSEARVRSVSAQALLRGVIEEAAPSADHARELVSCGRAWGNDVVIVEPGSVRRCADGHVGEIWVSGPSITSGYWRHPDATTDTFGARLPGQERTFLRTGDLGAIVDGELYVTGRAKDLIIIRGGNHYPQDIERTVESVHPALRPGCGAAFQVDSPGGELVVVHEIRSGLDAASREAIEREARRRVASEHGVKLDGLMLVEPGSIPKTSSGKIQRHRCRERWSAGALAMIAGARAVSGDSSAPLRGFEREVALAFEEALSVSGLGDRDDFLERGGDSLAAIRIAARLSARLAVDVTAEDLLDHPSVGALAQLLDARLTASGASPAEIPPSQRMDAIASFAQERLWFLNHWADPGTYNMSCALHVLGPASVALLEATLRRLVHRHEALRTTLAEIKGELRQGIGTPPELDLRVLDLSSLAPEERPQALQRWVRAEARRPFDLQHGPWMFRALLFRLAPEEHVLQLTVHHIAGDAWSVRLLVADVTRIYASLVAGQAPLEAAPLTRYADFAEWQRTWLDAGRRAALRGYWLDKLRDLPELCLPTDRAPGPGRGRSTGPSVRFDLGLFPGEAARAVRARRATDFMALLSCLDILLFHITGEPDVAVGAHVAGRCSRELQDVVGCFINTLVLRTDISSCSTFLDVLDRVRPTVLDALKHQHLPFQEVVELMRPNRQEGRNPLFQVLFDHDADWPPRVHLPGTETQWMDADNEQVVFDLVFLVRGDAAGLHGHLVYNAEVFDHATVEGLARQLSTIIDAVSSRPQSTIEEIRSLVRESQSRDRARAQAQFQKARAKSLRQLR